MSPTKILVVDDSDTERSMMAAALTARGYELLTAENGPQALAIAKEQQPALVVLDVVLPKPNGFQVCRRLKMAPETHGIKVVLVSSKSQETDIYWGKRQGADDYLVKPFSDEELCAAVACQLGGGEE